jgi:hypothetical protein
MVWIMAHEGAPFLLYLFCDLVVNFYKTAHHYFKTDGTVHSHKCKNIKANLSLFKQIEV